MTYVQPVKMTEAGLRVEDGLSVLGPGLAGSRDRSGTMRAVVAIGESADRQVKSAADPQPTSLKDQGQLPCESFFGHNQVA